FSLVAIGNGAFSGGGFRLTPNALPDDGLLDVCLVSQCSRCRLLRCLPSSLNGTHGRHSIVTFHRVRHLTIASQEPIQAQVDGELLEPRHLWHIHVEPSRLAFLKPASIVS
ncbi:MAG TPA: sphingosine kinase, partial [bacterium]|nr:sphingosine kinase [bacterium]